MDFDIVIVGGGLVGASLACALKDQPFKIAILDQEKAVVIKDPKLSINVDSRALVLSYTSIQCLKTVGVWDQLSCKACPILTVHASKKGHFGQTRILASEYKLSELGQVISADDLLQALYRFLEKCPLNSGKQISHPLEILRPDKIVKLEKQNGLWLIDLESGKQFTAKLLVGADGPHSFVRQYHGIDAKIHDYEQTAIVCNILLSQSHQGVAYERFLPQGSIAMLPFGENLVKSVWIVDNNELQKISELSDIEFLQSVQEQFGNRLGNFLKIGKRIQYPLRLNYADSIYGQQFVLIGNAANTLNPIAAQGFNLGLRDVATLAEVLVQSKNSGVDFSGIDVLAAYAAERQLDHQAIRLLTNQLANSSVLQGLGVLATEWFSPFKRKLVEQGLGRQQPLPSLCRGLRL